MKKINWDKQNVLVTGGTGFIGANLAVALNKNGANVVVVERAAGREDVGVFVVR